MSELLDGKWLSSTIREELKDKVEQLKGVRLPKLVVVLVGDDPASHTYVNAKEKACKDVGFVSQVHRLSAETSNVELLALIQSLNEDETVDGILVQMPIPKHLDSKAVIMAIDPEKDVDGFHPINVGKLHSNEKTFVPCTPLGVMKLLEVYNIDVSGLNTVVLGRSHLVGRPIAQLLVNANATVTICHSRSKHIDEICRRADLIVAAVGVPHFVKKDWIKKGAVVVDVGIHRDEDNKIIGDVVADAMELASFMTPVPKGVGPMTIAMLLSNTFDAYQQHLKG
jgi:methylenetetrahydrofolate dehydrogenase (NADP+)/methenyltetrahydrofolate cyclohydrolase